MATFSSYYANNNNQLNYRSLRTTHIKSKSSSNNRFKPYNAEMRETITYNGFKRKNLCRDKRTNLSVSDLFDFITNSPSKAAKIDKCLGKFNPNVPNLVNTSPTKMKELKDRFNCHKRFDLSGFCTLTANLRQSDKYENKYYEMIEEYNTVYVTKFQAPKPSKMEILNFFKKFGKIADITTNSNIYKCSYAFIRFESASDAYKLYSSRNSIEFSYKCVRKCQVVVAPRMKNCYDDGCLESIAASHSINNEQIAEKIRNITDINEQIDTLCSELLLTDNDLKNRKEIVNKLQKILNREDFGCKFYIFGSCVNKLGFRDTDIDIFIDIPYLDNMTKKLYYERALTLLHQIRAVFRQTLGMFIPKPIESKKCPILRLDFKHMSDNLRANGITCDISLTNSLGIRNSKLIAFLCDFEPRFRKLSIVLRYWAKINDYIGSYQLSSYAFSMLIIFFCQKQVPPLLPKIALLKELARNTGDVDIVEGEDRSFCKDIDLVRSKFTDFNQQSVAELIPQFFYFYANYNFVANIICPLNGRSKRKLSENQTLRENASANDAQLVTANRFKTSAHFCIQDPFEKCINLTAHTRDHVYERFVGHFKMMANNETDWSLSKLIRVVNECLEIDDSDSDSDSDVYYYVSEEESSSYFDNFRIGKVNVKFEAKHSDTVLLSKLIEMTNLFRKNVLELLSCGYGFDCEILHSSDIKLHDKSTFATMKCKFRGYDKLVTDEWNREPALDKLRLDDSLSTIEREKFITENIRDELPYTQHCISIPIHITFEFVLDTCSKNYMLLYRTTQILPDVERENGFVDFVRKSVRKFVQTEGTLNIDDDIIIL